MTGARSGEPPLRGELAFRASVLGNSAAFSGYVFLEDDGKAAFVSDGQQAVGRGVGRWVSDGAGRLAAVELDIYQYHVAATDIPERPHRFRGLWALRADGAPVEGDWYVVPSTDAPQRIGTFEAAASRQELESLSSVQREARVLDAARDELFASLDSLPPVTSPVDTADERLKPFKLGGLESVYYIPEWVDAAQEASFVRHADVELNGWDHMKTRSSQEWGAGDKCACGRGLMREPLPPLQKRLAVALHALGVFDGVMYPMNSVRINGYRPGQGIHPHCDGPVYYPQVAILSLQSPCLFNLFPKTGTEDCMRWDPDNDVPGGHTGGHRPEMSILLEPRSLLVFGKDAFWHHRHGIEASDEDVVTSKVSNLHLLKHHKIGDVVQRRRRVSYTMRHLLPRCACQG